MDKQQCNRPRQIGRDFGDCTRMATFKCKGCHFVGYCSTECEKLDRLEHEKSCSPIVYDRLAKLARFCPISSHLSSPFSAMGYNDYIHLHQAFWSQSYYQVNCLICHHAIAYDAKILCHVDKSTTRYYVCRACNESGQILCHKHFRTTTQCHTLTRHTNDLCLTAMCALQLTPLDDDCIAFILSLLHQMSFKCPDL